MLAVLSQCFLHHMNYSKRRRNSNQCCNKRDCSKGKLSASKYAPSPSLPFWLILGIKDFSESCLPASHNPEKMYFPKSLPQSGAGTTQTFGVCIMENSKTQRLGVHARSQERNEVVDGWRVLTQLWPRFTSHSNLLTQFKHPNEEFLREKTSDLLCFSGGIAFWVSFFLLSVESFQAQEPHFHPSFCRA